jgi:hypothetical protein|tara:strand:+ start:538 stop:1014 length:477 start_codon:yes stop_codon:yes gene_type:complete
MSNIESLEQYINNLADTNENDTELDETWVRYTNHPGATSLKDLITLLKTDYGKIDTIKQLKRLHKDIEITTSFEDWFFNGEVKIWRGIRNKYEERGVASWTLNKDIAETFANTDKTQILEKFEKPDVWTGDKEVLERTVSPNDILGFNNRMGEEEVII